MLPLHTILVRLLVALALTGVVGLQRTINGQAAGLRTHILVGTAAAMFTLLSPYLGSDRLASQIVPGIGFLGGGAILKERGAIRGLTTAAGIWSAAALGMAAGSGWFELGILGAALALLTLVVLQLVEMRVPASHTWTLVISLPPSTDMSAIGDSLSRVGLAVALVGLRHDTHLHLTYTMKLRASGDASTVVRALHQAGALHVTCAIGTDLETTRET